MLRSYLFHSMSEFLSSFEDSHQKLLLLVAENFNFEHEMLSQVKAEICGAIFPQVIFQDKNYDDALLVVELSQSTQITLTSFKNFDKTTIDNQADDMIVFVDGLSCGITNFLENLYESSSLYTNIIGAGAGKLTLKQEEVLFTKDGIIKDGALLITNSWHIKIGVEHGWEQIAGPFIANNVQNNLVHSLDYKDAFEVYQNIVEKDSHLSFNENNFFDIAKSYPLGVAKANGEILVRDPIAKDDNSLMLVGDIDNNSIVYILKGSKNKLIASAQNASIKAISQKEDIQGIFIVDCISRVLFLEDAFNEELEIIKTTTNKQNIALFGVLSLGEIANANSDYIDFYNKTCVIGAF